MDSRYILTRIDHKGSQRLVISFPKKLCVHDPVFRDECIAMLDFIRIYTSTESGIHIDLSDVRSMSAPGAVALFAIITSSQVLKQDDFFSFQLPESIAMKRQIRGSGLWDAIRNGGKRKLERLWHNDKCLFQSGYDPNQHLDPTIKFLESQVELPFRLKEAINEAMLNIAQHAYSLSGSVTRWWQYAALNRDKTNFIFVICDRGHTIPRNFKHLGLTDPSAIKHAMTTGISSTGDPWRGKGSGNIKKPIEMDENDKLIVISRNGLYKYVSKDQPPETAVLDSPFYGTLVAWSFAL